jgi:hypothetical protein
VRFILILAALTFSGCAIFFSPLPKNDLAATAQAEKWVPIGTSAADAQHIMEHHGFKCYELKKSSARDRITGDLVTPDNEISCHYRAEGLLSDNDWDVTLFLEDGKVKSVTAAFHIEGTDAS